jgi:hypothetical protein
MTNRYSLSLLALLALGTALPAQAQYGSGLVQQVPRATGTITLDGNANEADWANATNIDVTANWDGAWSGHPDPDVTVTAKVMWANGVLYVYARHEDYQNLFWNGGGGEQIIVGVDLPHAGGERDGNFGGWVDNMPNLGPVAYKVWRDGITANFQPADSIDVEANGWAAGEVFVNEASFTWGVEMAVYGAQITENGQIGFNIGGATGSLEQAGGDPTQDGAYAFYAWQVCDDPGPDSFCHYAGGNVMSDAESFATLSFVNTVANEGGAENTASALRDASPNPFRGATTLGYEMDRPGAVALTVYDVLGRQVATLDEGAKAAGTYTATLDASALPAGVYVVRMAVDGAAVASRQIARTR